MSLSCLVKTSTALIQHYRTNALAFMHQMESIVDFFERHGVRDQVIDVDAFFHVPVDNFGHVGTAARATKGGTAPAATSYELEWTRGNFLACTGYADDE